MKRLSKIFILLALIGLFSMIQNANALVSGGGAYKGAGAWKMALIESITSYTLHPGSVTLQSKNGKVVANFADSTNCLKKLWRAYFEKVNHCNSSISVLIYGFAAHHHGYYEVDTAQCTLYNDSSTDYCDRNVYGCTNPSADNYNASATKDNGTCKYTVYGCTDKTANNYNSKANKDDGTCTYTVLGCTDSNANNFNSKANKDNGSCTYDEEESEEVTEEVEEELDSNRIIFISNE